MIKNNSEHAFIFPEIPVKAICLMLQRYVNCLWTFAFVPTPRKSGAAKFTARKELEWGSV